MINLMYIHTHTHTVCITEYIIEKQNVVMLRKKIYKYKYSSHLTTNGTTIKLSRERDMLLERMNLLKNKIRAFIKNCLEIYYS